MAGERYYLIDLYIDGQRQDYFPPKGLTLEERLEDVKEWASRAGFEKYHVVVKQLENWYIHKYDPVSDKLKLHAQIYIGQISSFSEIVERFTGRIAYTGKLAKNAITQQEDTTS